MWTNAMQAANDCDHRQEFDQLEPWLCPFRVSSHCREYADWQEWRWEFANRTTHETIPFERDDLFREQIRDFLSARSGEDSIGCGAQEGVDSTVLMESVLASLAKKTRISVLEKN